jgi:predicted kinase
MFEEFLDFSKYKKPVLVLTVGASASGKTTFVEKQLRKCSAQSITVNLNRDDVRFGLFCDGERDWTKYKFNNKNEARVTEVIDEAAGEALYYRHNIIVSDTNLNPAVRENWKKLAKLYDYEYIEIPVECEWAELVKRNNNRQGGIDLKILRDQYMRMNEYLGRKTYTPNVSKPKAFIVDVDGTVADMEGIRKPYDWDKVHLDRPRESVIAMVTGLVNSGYKIIFLSGRDGVCFHKTRDWLKEYFGTFETLLMRKADDPRKDYIIKEELFWAIADDYNIVGAIDDRHQVLRLWEEIGIKDIINVNRGLYNEF